MFHNLLDQFTFYIPEHTIIKISLVKFYLDYLTNDDQGSKHVQNASNSLPFDTKSYHRRLVSLMAVMGLILVSKATCTLE